MAKQTFTTGQVLTAAQMTSLQQTAMGGGSTTPKTASYTLVAADAGTVIQMNSASATTITVNTALFAAGDSVQIQNIGAGVCTVTAGTATVTTAGSLALSQWEGGNLYFTSTSASIFFDIVQGAGGMTVIESGSFSSTSTLISGIPATYKQLVLQINAWYLSATGWGIYLRLNDDSGANRYYNNVAFATTGQTAFNATKLDLTMDNFGLTTSGYGSVTCTLPNYASTTAYKQANITGVGQGNSTNPSYFTFQANGGLYNQLTAVSSLRITNGAGATQNGTYTLYGVS
jgi:hypothetical protein